ncbi:hypothetical protein OCD65_24710 [Bacillus paranthracis]|uniref:hypothetical protein n=1 Tax=Bacillus paranthracis TaxID=2026186 RepID=UPI0021D2BDE3|nr:hypothetical protein [Bacillus paranthracis]MDA2113376.1 hypothetical protein [Bacillus cereus]MCU5019890.1 hypothetical protein [Bacillus paranthracis]MDA2129730.1 hypothetical protein [Bacillus cereus]MDA2152164.1 hypothetical protein [Bacillus cereus]MEB8550921.1 hypothetical protein [Bacillus cereus]
MSQWIKEKAWWIGLVVTVLIGLFPGWFAKIGEGIKNAIVEYWLQLSIALIIVLLVAIYLRVVHRE